MILKRSSGQLGSLVAASSPDDPIGEWAVISGALWICCSCGGKSTVNLRRVDKAKLRGVTCGRGCELEGAELEGWES